MQPRLRGRSVLVRYADDVVIVVEQELTPTGCWRCSRNASGGSGSRCIRRRADWFGSADRAWGWRPGQDGDRFPLPGTFDFLGFTHDWCIARNGSWVLKRKTAKDRLRRSLMAVNRWCDTHRHESIAEQHRMLVGKLRGHCAYFGIRGNASSLTTFGFHVVHIWHKWLNRRSEQRSMPWTRFLRLLARYPLPRMMAAHFATGVSRNHLPRSRMRKNPHVRICGGLGSATTLVYPTPRVYRGPIRGSQNGNPGLSFRHRIIHRSIARLPWQSKG